MQPNATSGFAVFFSNSKQRHWRFCVYCIQNRIIRGVVSYKAKYKPVWRLTPWMEIPHLNFLETTKCPQAVVILPLSFQTHHKNIYIYIHCTDGTLQHAYFGLVSVLSWHTSKLLTFGCCHGLCILSCSDFLLLPETASHCFFFEQWMCVTNSAMSFMLFLFAW